MKKFEMKYGKDKRSFSIPQKNLLGIIRGNGDNTKLSEAEVILRALENPIDSPRLENIVKPGEKICIVISDITRAWQKMSLFLPYIVDKLNEAGIDDQDITFLCATGSHRSQTKEEHKVLLGEKLSKRFEVIDHDSRDEENMVHLGTTSFGTPVSINKIAMESDHIILTGAVVFHDLAGWGGGKKSILPGIASYESIMANHSLSLSPNIGEGIHPMVKSGNISNNPIHEDMLEAAGFVNPSFLFNVIIDSKGNICDAVAGHYIKAHEEGQKKVSNINGIPIKEKADLVVVSAGGYPKDIDLYQASKALINAKEAVKKDGGIIMVSQCIEGVGHRELKEIIEDYDNNLEREKSVRNHYTVSRFIGYLIAEIARKYNIILISDIDDELLKKINIRSANDIDEALDIFYKEKGKDLKTYIMPNGSETLPVFL